MSRRRVLIAGLGSIGRRHVQVIRRHLPDAEIVALRRPETRSEPGPVGVDQVVCCLEEACAFRPDIAVIATPAPQRLQIAEALLDAGAHLLLEKPLATDKADLSSLFDVAAAATDRVIRVGYTLRHLPILAEARAQLAAGSIGAVRLARFEVGQYLPDWRNGDYRAGVSAQAALGGGALLELSHEIDLALWMLGGFDRVVASVGRVSDLAIDVEDHATLVLHRPDLSVTVHLDFLQRVARRRALFVGSDATLEVDALAQTAELQRPTGSAALFAPRAEGEADAYHRQFDTFCARVLPEYQRHFEPGPESATLAEAAAALAVVRAARASSPGAEL